jgi:signal transduction histidine kinase
MEQEAGDLMLTVSDNGCGFARGCESAELSLGLLGMKERARLLGGDVDIATVERKGTTVAVRIPVGG